MKKAYIIFILFFALAYACKEDNTTDEVTGTGSLTIKIARTALDTLPASYTAVVTLLNSKGEAIMNNKIMLFNKTKSYYESDSISLNKGTYTITRLSLYNSSWECVYVSPQKDSKVGIKNKGIYLPYDAVVSPNFSIKAFPGIIKTTGYLPSELGYTSYYYKQSNSITFKIASLEAQVQSTYFYTAPKMTVTSDSFKYVTTLNDSINTIEVPDLNVDLKFEFSQSGYTINDSILYFSRDVLLNYAINPLLIYTIKQ